MTYVTDKIKRAAREAFAKALAEHYAKSGQHNVAKAIRDSVVTNSTSMVCLDAAVEAVAPMIAEASAVEALQLDHGVASIDNMRSMMKNFKPPPELIPRSNAYGQIRGYVPSFYVIDDPIGVLPEFDVVRSPGHPFVKWLARILPQWCTFDPDVVIEVPRQSKPYVYVFGNKLLISPCAYSILSKDTLA